MYQKDHFRSVSTIENIKLRESVVAQRVTNPTGIHEDPWSRVAVSCGVDHRRGSDLAVLWLWCRLAAAALIWPPAWKLTCAMDTALQNQKNKTTTHLWISPEVSSHYSLTLRFSTSASKSVPDGVEASQVLFIKSRPPRAQLLSVNLWDWDKPSAHIPSKQWWHRPRMAAGATPTQKGRKWEVQRRHCPKKFTDLGLFRLSIAP